MFCRMTINQKDLCIFCSRFGSKIKSFCSGTASLTFRPFPSQKVNQEVRNCKNNIIPEPFWNSTKRQRVGQCWNDVEGCGGLLHPCWRLSVVGGENHRTMLNTILQKFRSVGGERGKEGESGGNWGTHPVVGVFLCQFAHCWWRKCAKNGTTPLNLLGLRKGSGSLLFAKKKRYNRLPRFCLVKL